MGTFSIAGRSSEKGYTLTVSPVSSIATALEPAQEVSA
jgi:hypothetical protein